MKKLAPIFLSVLFGSWLVVSCSTEPEYQIVAVVQYPTNPDFPGTNTEERGTEEWVVFRGMMKDTNLFRKAVDSTFQNRSPQERDQIFRDWVNGLNVRLTKGTHFAELTLVCDQPDLAMGFVENLVGIVGREHLNRLHRVQLNTINVLEARLEHVLGELDSLETSIRTFPKDADKNDLLELEREFKITENLYVFLLEKKAEESITLASAVEKVVVIDGPKKVRITNHEG